MPQKCAFAKEEIVTFVTLRICDNRVCLDKIESGDLDDLIHRIGRTLESDQPDVFIFRNENGDFLDSGNFQKRVVNQLVETLSLPKLTFQIVRRTIETLSHTKGHLKSILSLLMRAKDKDINRPPFGNLPVSLLVIL